MKWSWMPGMIFLLAVGSTDAQITQQWVARYQGAFGGGDWPTAIAVDGSGKVYVTGVSFTSQDASDYATVAYGASGNQLWVARYHGPVPGDLEMAKAIALDGLGNVYVTGGSKDGATSWALTTVAYDANGNQLWVARYRGPGSGGGANAITTDGAGNVYVTGTSNGGPTHDDYTTLAYDVNGNQLWVARYQGPGPGASSATAIATDGSGNVYVTGYSNGVGTGYDYATVAYDANGNQLWVARYNGPVNRDDEAFAIAIDSFGNVYVTGFSFATGGTDYATVAYDANGNQLWVARYRGPGSGGGATAIATDGSGNVYVTGYNADAASWPDYATVAYDANGNQLWVARYHGPGIRENRAFAIAVDASSTVYVTGTSEAATDYVWDYATVAYDASGNQLWVARYHGPAPNGSDGGRAIALDATGNVYVTGQSGSTATSSAYATLKYLVGACPLGAEDSLRQPSILEGETAGASCPSLTCGTVSRGSSVSCTVTNYGSGTLSNWRFTEGANTVRGSGSSATWSGTAVQSGTVRVDVIAGGITQTLRASLTVNNRNWHTNPASPMQVPNGTFITLPVPPQPSGTDSGLGEFKESTSDPGGPNLTTISGGPNSGYAYFATQLSISTLFQYEINPDLENSTSVFSRYQWGNCGFISWSDLFTQTKRHEYNSSTQSHYAFYTNSINSTANNPGDFFERQVAPPGTDLIGFRNNVVRPGLDARYNQILTDTRRQPFEVNRSETGTFLGDINYAPYTPCP